MEIVDYGTDPHLLHRNDSPDTSVQAAHVVDTTVLERKVHNAIKDSGSVGLISDDILDMYPHLPYSSVTARFSALVNKKYIFRREGDTRKGHSGRQQMVMRDITYSRGDKMSTPSWSFSRIKSFEQCPKQFYHLKVVKDYAEPETEAMLYGTSFHTAAEKYVRDEVELPPQFEYARRVLDSLNNKEGDKLCEYRMGLTEDLTPCKFYADNVWWRGIVDLAIVDKPNKLAWVVDYKTGKNTRYADKGQLELMALAMFKHFPYLETIRGGLLFVVADELIVETYTADMQEGMWDKWLADHQQMETAFENDVWNPNPSGLCKRHCAVTECVHNGRY